jgi:hypothetical protein
VQKIRDYSPDTPLYLEKCGSDCCEKHFSAQGSWQENKRNYNASTMQNCAQKENWLSYLKVNREGSTWARSKIHSREWDEEDEEDIDFIIPQGLTDVVIADAWQSEFDAAKKCLSTVYHECEQRKHRRQNDASSESHWWESPTGLYTPATRCARKRCGTTRNAKATARTQKARTTCAAMPRMRPATEPQGLTPCWNVGEHAGRMLLSR